MTQTCNEATEISKNVVFSLRKSIHTSISSNVICVCPLPVCSVMRHSPSPFLPRLFEGWRTWEKFSNSDGSVGYLVGYVPSNRYSGYNDISAGDRHVKASTTAIYIISEISPNVCKWTYVQCMDLKAWQ